MLFAIATLNYADRTAISSVFPLLRADLGASNVGLAAIGSVFLWSYAIGSPFAGLLADRVSRSRVVIWSLVSWSAVTFFSGFVPNIGALLSMRALLGFAECAYIPAAVALIADHHPAGSRATAIGIHAGGLNFGLVAGGVAAGYLGDHFGWRWNCLVLGAAGLLLAVVATFVLEDGPFAEKSARQEFAVTQSLASLVRVPVYPIIVAEAMLIAFVSWTFLNWLPLYFEERFTMSLTAGGISGTLMLQVAAIIGGTGGGYLSDKIASHRPQRRMLLLAANYLLAAPFLLAFTLDASYGALSASIFAYSLFRNLGTANEYPILCDQLRPKLRAAAIGLINTCNNLAGGIGILIAGLLKSDYDLGAIFGTVSGIVLLAACIVLAGYFLFGQRDSTVEDHNVLI